MCVTSSGVGASSELRALPAEVALAASPRVLPDGLTAGYLLTPANHPPVPTGQSQGKGRIRASTAGISVSFSCQV